MIDTASEIARKSKRLALLVAPIVLLSGCAPLDWVKEKLGCSKQRFNDTVAMSDGTQNLADDGSKVLASIGDKAIVTEKSLTRDFDRLLEDEPRFRQMLPMIPDVKYSFCKGLVSQAVVDKDIVDKKIDQTKEYQEEFARAVRSVKSMLNTKYFGQQYPVQLTDADAKAFYEERKSQIPELLISRGGVNAVGLSCKSEAEAKDFAGRAKGKNLAQVAEAAGKKTNFRDFKLVNEQTVGVDAALKSKIASLKKFPTTDVMKATDGVFWVVSATGVEEPKYLPFEQVKEGLKQYAEKEQSMEKINKEIERLSKEYKVVINEDYFKKSAESQQVGSAPQQEQRVADATQSEPVASTARVA